MLIMFLLFFNFLSDIDFRSACQTQIAARQIILTDKYIYDLIFAEEIST